MKLTAQVRDGKLVPDSPVAWTIMLQEFAGKAVVLDVDVPKKIRTIRQNSRHWSVLIPLLGHYLSKTRDVPLSKEQVHAVAVSAFLGCEETELGLAPMRTRDLTTKQFAHMDEQIALFLMEKGYPIPEPGETVEM